MYHDVLRLGDAQKLMNCSFVQVSADVARVNIYMRYAYLYLYFIIYYSTLTHLVINFLTKKLIK